MRGVAGEVLIEGEMRWMADSWSKMAGSGMVRVGGMWVAG